MLSVDLKMSFLIFFSIFGSPLCPRISDVPILEPLVCTRILKDRVTDLVFRRDTIHIVDQQGLFLAWQRPVSYFLCNNV